MIFTVKCNIQQFASQSNKDCLESLLMLTKKVITADTPYHRQSNKEAVARQFVSTRKLVWSTFGHICCDTEQQVAAMYCTCVKGILQTKHKQRHCASVMSAAQQRLQYHGGCFATWM